MQIKGWDICDLSEVVVDRNNLYNSISQADRQRFKDKSVPFRGVAYLEWDFDSYDYKLEERFQDNGLRCYWRSRVV